MTAINTVQPTCAPSCGSCGAKGGLLATLMAACVWGGVATVDALHMPRVVETARDMGVTLSAVSRAVVEFHQSTQSIGSFLLPLTAALTLIGGLFLRKLSNRLTTVVMMLWLLAGGAVLSGMLMTMNAVNSAGSQIAP